MNFKILFLLFLCAALATSSSSTTSSPPSCSDDCTPDEISQFQKFKKDFSRSYESSDEECTAREIFCQNYRIIQAHNSNPDATYKMRVTINADQSESNCQQTGFEPLAPKEAPESNTTATEILKSASKAKMTRKVQNIRSVRGEVNNGRLTGPVRDQGSCGSCWTFCSTAVLNYQAAVYRNTSIEMSEQDLLECAERPAASDNGCNGGNAYYSFEYARTKGLVQLVKYPYRMIATGCRRSSKMGTVYRSPFPVRFAIPSDANALKRVIDQLGVVAISIAVTKNFMFYDSGIFSDPACPTKTDHCMALVGYGTDPQMGDYWILKNSWGVDWGEQGYCKLKRGVNMCGMEKDYFFVPTPM